MPDDELQAFVKDFENGVLAPSVDSADIRRMWEATSKIRDETGPTRIGICLRTLTDLDTGVPEASLNAAWIRTGLLDAFVRTGVLKPWTPGSDYEQRVFEVVATFPVRVGEFDGDAFLRQIGE